MPTNLVDRPCPLCGSSDRSREIAPSTFDANRLDRFAFASRKVPEYLHHRLVLCEPCDLLYASPVPPSEKLDEEYCAAAYDSGIEARFAAKTYARLLDPIARRLPSRAGALDIGAGDGAFLAELLKLGFQDVVGSEPSAAPIAAAEPEIRPLLRHAPFRVDDFQGRQLSLVTCFQTMEHVPEPLQLCRDASALLRTGGAMMLVVHNRKSMSARLLGYRSPIFDIEHLQLFSMASIKRLLEGAGFRDVGVRFILNRYPLNYWLRLFPLPKKLKPGVIAAANAALVGRVPIAVPAGNIMAVGFKP